MQAGEICNTLPECQTIRAQVDKRIRELQGSINTIGDFLRNPDGSVRTKINQIEASRECERLGTRLPTVRELAQEGTKLGAALLEVSEYRSGKIPLGYARDDFYKIETKEGDTFYYSYRNYKRPSGDLGNYWVWSSSLHPNDGDNAFVFNGYYGSVFSVSRYFSYYYYAVRCVARVNR